MVVWKYINDPLMSGDPWRIPDDFLMTPCFPLSEPWLTLCWSPGDPRWTPDDSLVTHWWRLLTHCWTLSQLFLNFFCTLSEHLFELIAAPFRAHSPLFKRINKGRLKNLFLIQCQYHENYIIWTLQAFLIYYYHNITFITTHFW